MATAKTRKTKKNETNVVSKSSMILAVTATLLISLSIGYVVGALYGVEEKTVVEHESESHEHSTTSGSHSHSETYEIPEGEPTPRVELMVTKDSKSGWNVALDVANFTFAPENVNMEHVSGEGHAHLWVDGEKITRLYATDYYLGELDEGEHEIEVTLNTNKHQDYTVMGKVVSDTVRIVDTHHAE